MSDTPSPQSIDDEPFDLEREPLDPPTPMSQDWGGDGTDLSRPVRAHVLAALRPNTAPYTAPLDALLTLGDPRDDSVVEHRRALSVGQEYLPDLLRMARDRELYTADGDTDDVWAPLHAIAIMGDLDLSDSVSEIVPLLDLEDDWFATALPELFGKIGAPALGPLGVYLADHSRWAYGHAEASRALEQIANQHPELREQVVATLSDVLRDAEHYDEVVNTAAMYTLVEIKAVETMPLIRRVFELGLIDEMMRGPWGQVLEDLGVEPEEGDPLLAESERRFEERRERFFPREQRELLQESLANYIGRHRLDPLESDTTSTQSDPLRSLEADTTSTQSAPLRSLEAQATSAVQPAPQGSRRAPQTKANKKKNKRKIESASRKANRRTGK